MKKTHPTLDIKHIKITQDSSELDKLYGITDEIKELLIEYSAKAQKGKNGALKPLNKLIKQYPHVPQFKNQLTTLYAQQKNLAMAQEVNKQIERAHPDYLFGKLNKANLLIADNELDEIPEILGETFDLKALYPHRTEFHISEVAAFYKTLFKYALATEDEPKATAYLGILESLNQEFEMNLDLSDFTMQLSVLRVDKMLSQREDERKNAVFVEVIPKKIGEKTTEPPHFQNELIGELYRNNLYIDQALVQQILQLPRQSLLEDLHKVVHDSILRFEYFRDETEWEWNTHNFLQHAIFLLMDLKEKTSVECLLDTLRQDNDYFNYWYSDTLTEDVWKYLYTLCLDDIEPLRRFILEPNRDPFARGAASNALVQIALHHPERRSEIVECYRAIIDELLQRADDETIIDSEFISSIVSDILDIKGVELSDEVTKLYDKGWILYYNIGNRKEFLEEIHSNEHYETVRKVPTSIEEWYSDMLTWQKEQDDDDFYDEDEDEEPDNYEELKRLLPLADNPKPNVGRNDPCLCGSGKKFKKCCLSKYE